jgi:hypothetical protein
MCRRPAPATRSQTPVNVSARRKSGSENAKYPANVGAPIRARAVANQMIEATKPNAAIARGMKRISPAERPASADVIYRIGELTDSPCTPKSSMESP